VLGQPDTLILVGSDDFDTGPQPAGRVTLGWWCDPGCRGIQASYLGLGEQTTRFQASSDEIPILARPFINNQANAAMLVAHPNFLEGSIGVETTSELQTLEALFRQRVFEAGNSRVDFLFGYQYARLDESLRIDQFSEWIAPQANIIPGTTQRLFDQFDAENQFHGGVLAVNYERQCGLWSLEALLKVGLGNSHSQVQINGSTTNTVPNAGSATFVGGLLAQQTNIGVYEQDQFAVIPELGVTLARQLSDRVRVRIGYSVLYWNNLARPSEQIDPVVSQFPPQPPAGTQQPRFQFVDGSFWAQGLHFGAECRF
jgi:hypothetical protein